MFGKTNHIHFIGIGGTGMSGIASVLLDQGYHVSGSDMADSPTVQRLIEAGAIIGTFIITALIAKKNLFYPCNITQHNGTQHNITL